MTPEKEVVTVECEQISEAERKGEQLRWKQWGWV
jgi:hypothetical protein